MGADKNFPLSITLRTVDKATSGLKRVNDQLEKTFSPVKKLSKELGGLYENAGISRLAAGFRGITNQIKSLATGLGFVGAAGVGAVVGLKHLVDGFDELGDKAEAIGIGVAPLVQLRHAAERSGGEVDALDSSLQSFNKNLGMAKAGTGRFAGFLKKASPALLKQIKGAKGSEEAFDLLADAMVKLEDPSKRAALAAAAGFDPSLIPLLAKGSKAIHALRGEVEESSKAQADAAKAAGPVDDAWKRFLGSVNQVKASLVTGLAPTFEALIGRARAFLDAHQGQIAAWIQDFGEKLPGRIDALIGFMGGLKNAVVAIAGAIGSVVEKLGGAESAVKILIAAWVAFKGLQLVSSIGQIIVSLGQMATAAAAARAAIAATGATGLGAGAAKAALGGGALLAGAGAVVGAGALGAGVGYGIDNLVGWATGRSLSDRLGGVEGDYLDPAMVAAKRRARLAKRTSLGVAKVADSIVGSSPTEKAKVVVDFRNAPKGTRVTTDPRSTADVETSVGMSMVTP